MDGCCTCAAQSVFDRAPTRVSTYITTPSRTTLEQVFTSYNSAVTANKQTNNTEAVSNKKGTTRFYINRTRMSGVSYVSGKCHNAYFYSPSDSKRLFQTGEVC